MLYGLCANISVFLLNTCMPMRQKATALYPHPLVTINKCLTDHESVINWRDEAKDWYWGARLLTKPNFLWEVLTVISFLKIEVTLCLISLSSLQGMKQPCDKCNQCISAGKVTLESTVTHILICYIKGYVHGQTSLFCSVLSSQRRGASNITAQSWKKQIYM